MIDYALKDFTAHLPNRKEMAEMAGDFGYMSSYNWKWTRDHRHLVDKLFSNSGMKDHYWAFLKQMKSEGTRKKFKGMILNQQIFVMLCHLEQPNRCGDKSWDGLTPIVYAILQNKYTFSKRYVTERKTWGDLDHMSLCNDNLKRCNFTKKQLVDNAKMMIDVIEERALFLQAYWHKTQYYKDNWYIPPAPKEEEKVGFTIIT